MKRRSCTKKDENGRGLYLFAGVAKRSGRIGAVPLAKGIFR